MSVLALVLAGGKGERLYPLTRDRAKPAVPFGGTYRIIDFTLSNCIHSGMKQILVLTQYRSFSLEKHIQLGWNLLSHKMGEFLHVISAQQQVDDIWYRGTADAVYQNLYFLQEMKPELTLILSGDHIYRMDYQEIIRFHRSQNADLTIATVPQPQALSPRFGVVITDPSQRVQGFEEKPSKPTCLPNDPTHFLASLGIYVFNTTKMVQRIIEDAKSESRHDFGYNVIPRMVESGDRVCAFVFRDPHTERPKYWRDVGTVQAYWEAHMDLVGDRAAVHLYNPAWPILTYETPAPPAVIDMAGGKRENKGITRSVVSNGCRLQACKVYESILSPYVTVKKGAAVEESILMDGVVIGEGARLRRVIADKGSVIPRDLVIGFDEDQDSRLFHPAGDGLVVIPKGTVG
jgi:glucose-1-phosphate adenylyltransferase